MSKLEFNKADLFHLAKKIANQKYSFPKNIAIKSTQNQPKNFLRTSYTTQNNNLIPRDLGEVNSEENNKRIIKKGIRIKNKFLEKDNIQINEEKMLHLLSERKKKMKMALNHVNDKSSKNLEKPKVIYISLDNSENIRNRNDISDSGIPTKSYHERNKYKKIIKNNSSIDSNNNNRQNELFKSKILPKKHIYNSNSDYYDNLNRNYIPNRYSIKSMKTTNENYLNLRNSNTSHNSLNKNKVNKINNYSRNNEKIKSNIVNHFYSLNKNTENNMDEIFEDINDKISEDEPNQKMNNINNNININININNNINNNDINMDMNSIKKIDNKIIKNTQESFNKLLQPNKFISYRHSVYKAHNKNNNIDINSYLSEYHSFNNENKTKDNNNLSEKIIKKYESHKIYYLKKTNNSNNDNDIEEEDNINDNDNDNDNNDNNKSVNYAEERNKKEINFEGNNSYNLMDYNTYNINVNFISDPKKYMQNGYFGSMKYINCNKGTLIPNRSKISLPKKKEELKNANVNNINSLGRAHQVYKTKPSDNEEKNTEIDTHINHNNSLASITKRIRKKYYKNNPKNNIAIKHNNNIIKNINIRKSSPNKSKTTIDKTDNNNNSKDNSNDNNNDNQKELSPNTNTNNNINNNINNNLINNKKDIIQLEDLLILEGKLCHLMDCLKYENPMPKMCIEWWNFYTYSSYFGKFPKLFPKTKDEDRDRNNYIISDYQIAHDSMMFELLSMIISYQILNDPKLNQNLINTLKNLINEVHQNFLIECDYILSKVNNQSLNNLWIKKLKNLILAKRNWSDNNSDKKNFHLDLIKQGNNIIQNLIQYLLSTYTRANSNNIDINSLTHFNKNISDIKLMELSGYYNRVISQENMKINKKFSYIIKKKSNDDKYVSIIVPYLPEEIEGKKKFTLVLDLDETLISFRIDEHHRGMVKMRPGLYKFLKNVGSKYELIIFTAGTQEYADPILDVIEKNEKFFAKRLYRQHTIFMNNTYIKDLTRLGRDLSKIIIVDNMPQNFGLQRENGIFIKNFFGEDKNDTALNDLTHILLKIASNPNNDVRTELKKYKEEIFTKITTNLNY